MSRFPTWQGRSRSVLYGAEHDQLFIISALRISLLMSVKRRVRERERERDARKGMEVDQTHVLHSYRSRGRTLPLHQVAGSARVIKALHYVPAEKHGVNAASRAFNVAIAF